MDRTSRSELLKIVESQKEKIQRYEARLRDIVSAYKGLLKEKEALEASFQCLTNSKQQANKKLSSASVDNGDKDNDQEKSDKEKCGFSDPLQSEDDCTESEDRVATLTSSLATLTNEKTRLESNYLAEKKLLKQEYEDLQKKLEEKEEISLKKQEEQEKCINELKQKLRAQQLEREQEQTDHAFMLRELQKLVNDGRTAREDLEYQLELTQSSLQAKEKATSQSEQYEKRIHDLSNELKVLRNRLKAAEEKANQPSPLLLQLQMEMGSLKSQYQTQVCQEQQRANEAEENLNTMAEQSEERVSGLEAKLSELSEVVGNYERLRLQDQQAIQRLKERVAQLDTENMALVQAARTPDIKKDLDENDSDTNLDIQALVTKIGKLKKLLKLALHQKTERTYELEGVFYSDLTAECSLCKKYEHELSTLKEEYERYKIRAQAILKSKSLKENTSQDEVLREQMNELREKIKSMHVQHDNEMQKNLDKIDSLHKVVSSLQEKHKAERNQMISEHQHQLSELEGELKKQRKRTVSMLIEKDQEIESLRSLANLPSYDNDFYSESKPTTESAQTRVSPERSDENTSLDEEQTVNLLLKNTPSGPGDMPLLHFAQETARKEVEISSLRCKKYQLETALRELQHAALTKEQRMSEELIRLEELVHKQKRDKSREGANLEYLKNVIYKFLICTDSAGRQKMLNAIVTILEFSPKERDKVQTFWKSRW
ncbi:GCC1 [Acanthosepion pharaonis]|uniref:GCC1 n=1 Tax=Acanthosepion pharaonis TaxID=158019 RepID=A0A812CVC7_ACAPH|nr:GCC1 [Sepia pharaonis]